MSLYMLCLTIRLFLNFLANFTNFETITVKCFFSCSFIRNIFKFHTCIKYSITVLACAFIWRSDYSWIFAEFLNFEPILLYVVTVKCLFYSFNRIVLKLYIGIKYEITHLACASFYDLIIFYLWVDIVSLKYILYCFDPIIFQFTGTKYGIIHLLVVFLTMGLFWNFWNLWNLKNNWMIYTNWKIKKV